MDSFRTKVLIPLASFLAAAALFIGFVLATTIVTLAWVQILG